MFQLLAVLQDVLAEEKALPGKSSCKGRLEDQVRQIQDGDDDLRNQVIADCLPYIKGVLRRMLQIPDIEKSDEYSIALTAFNDALSYYDCENNVPFLRFAGLVINRRIIDWIRSQRRNRQVLTFSQCEADHGEGFSELLGSVPGEKVWENMEIEEELVRLRLRLQDFNLTLRLLTRSFPKHRDTRSNCLAAARTLLKTPRMRHRFERECRFPASDLARSCGIPLKTIERNRSAIIFLALLLSSDLEIIKSYLSSYGKEENQ